MSPESSQDASTTETFDSSLALLDRLRNSDRRAAISRVASIIAHLIGTPLQVIAGRAALIQSSPEMASENARRIELQVDRLATRMHQLIGYLTTPEPECESRVVSELVHEALSLYAPIARHSEIQLTCHTQPPVGTVEGNSAMIVLTSLLSLATRVCKRGDAVELSFEPPDERAVVFTLTLPSFPLPLAPIDRLDPPESGENRGAEHLQVLSVCHAIARKHGGKLEVVPGQAPSTITIRFECLRSA